MPRNRPPYLQKEINRHGKVVWYVRIRSNPRIRIRGEYGSPEFMQAYNAAVNGREMPIKINASTNSLRWLIEQYMRSSEWLSLSQATRKQKENIFLHIIKKAGDQQYRAVTRKVVIASRDERAATPGQAALRGLFHWAVESEYVAVNPCDGVKPPKLKNTQGFEAWTEEDINRYESYWPEGTKERILLHALLYTGLRRGDAVRIGKPNITDGVATITTEKSGFKTEVTLPILPILQKTLDAGPTGETTFICGEQGQSLIKETFGNYFREACNKAGIKKSAHGVRKISATRAANAEATVAQLKSIFGWEADNMASHYTKTADRRRLAKEAITKLQKTQ